MRAVTAMRRVGVRFASIQAQAFRYNRHAHPTNALKLETVTIDTAALKPSQLLIRMVAAPITPADLSQVAGYGGKAASLPCTGGNEGYGIVEAVGAGVKGVAAGDYVVASLPGQGTWATHVVGDADAWTKVAAAPSESFPAEIAAVSVAAPLMARALLDKVPLAAGDVLVQNTALSTVGQAVIQYAAAKGVKTVNVLRQHDDWANTVYHLQGLGAGIVVQDTMAATPAFGKLLADLPAPKLGLNAAGGGAASSVARALAPGGTMVTYGSMSGAPVRAPASWFTGKNLTLSGFNLEAHLKSMTKEARDAAVSAAVADVAGGKVKLMVAREPFSAAPAALARSLAPHQRKVVLTFAQ